jgi:glycosyltransferase involved in cell wall biosynthesis
MDVSVIIPSKHKPEELEIVVQALCDQTHKPIEIVIIDSSCSEKILYKKIKNICNTRGVKVIYQKCENAFPGHARNIGLELTKADIIAFIDVQTIPRPNWLEISIKLIATSSADGVWGSTNFVAITKFERLVRDGFYGSAQCKTLPGSVFKRDVFNKVGQFISWTRAGEDTDWMLRLHLHKLKIVEPNGIVIDYFGLIDLNIKKIIFKWYRNYESSRELPQFFPQRLFIWLIIYPMIFLLAFNWNHLIANWEMDSQYYINHITKIITIIPIIIYFLVRGIILPLKRGVNIKKLLPIRFTSIIFICLIADAVKIFIFSLPKKNYFNKKIK